MIELTYTRPSPTPRLTIEDLEPDRRLNLDASAEHVIAVVQGVLCAMLEDGDVVLTPGDQITIPAGESRRVWNAGDEVARALVERR